MIVTTGYGYFKRNGRIVEKYELPAGHHPDPIGAEVFEVESKEDLDAIQLEKADRIIADEAVRDKKARLLASAATKLKKLGLTDEETEAMGVTQ